MLWDLYPTYGKVHDFEKVRTERTFKVLEVLKIIPLTFLSAHLMFDYCNDRSFRSFLGKENYLKPAWLLVLLRFFKIYFYIIPMSVFA